MANWWNNPLAENPMGYAALQDMEAASGLNNTDTYQGTDRLQSGLDVASLVPGVGDIAGPIADLRRMQQNPEERTLANIALFGLGALPAVPSLYYLMSRGGGLSRAVTPFSNQSGVIGYHGTKADFPNEEYYTTSHFGTRPQASNEILHYSPDGENYFGKYVAQDYLSNLTPGSTDELRKQFNIEGQNIRRVDLNIKKPLRIHDDGSGHDSYINYASSALFAKGITEKEYAAIGSVYRNTFKQLQKQFPNEDMDNLHKIADRRAREALIKNLENKGYDGFVYENKSEDIGRDSLIPFRNSQIESAFGRKSRFGDYEDYFYLSKEK